ncbi:calcium homeostasis modulator protein 5 [Spea bombifrons]|uniref:calcium homeostasis modulator protein 5 n=1 Tax=Spea bombifrons TaxID=233779 RepID=UPI00234A34ED|nr:calcium homeostasis modulator protein 5 [Spea bombifrons]
MDVIQKFVKFCVDRRSAIGYGFLALITVGSQQIFSLIAFQCPCSHQNLTYGLVFLFAPAVILLVLGYFLDSRTWKLFTGCCLNPKKILPQWNPCQCFQIFLQITMNAFVVPVMWISIALLNGSFYACAMSGWQNPQHVQYVCQNKSQQCSNQLWKAPCNKTAMPSTEAVEVVLLLQAQSQVLGWWLIVASSVICLLSTCYVSCRSKVSSQQMTFWRIYIEKERDKFDQLVQEYATKLAERNLRSFFENKKPDDFDMPDNKSWEEISALCPINSNRQYYSTLHRFVENCENTDGTKKEEFMEFVDGEQSIV